MRITLFYIFILTLMIACSNQQEERALSDELAAVDVIKQVPDAGQPTCGTMAAFNISIGSWRDSAEIMVAFGNKPDKMDFDTVKLEVYKAFEQWDKFIPNDITFTENLDEADILITFAYGDGQGGILGMSDYPPYHENGKKPIQMIFDLWDIQPIGDSGGSAYDLFTVALHEAGHSLGIKHSGHKSSVMWPSYAESHEDLHIDDKAAISFKYHQPEDFFIDNRKYVAISRDSESDVLPNFKEKEFFSKCTEYNGDISYIDHDLMNAVSFIRDFYNQPIQIISTYRPERCNAHVGGASMSWHKVFRAIDFKFVGLGASAVHRAFVEDVKKKGCLFNMLYSMNVRGFGLYGTSLHMDTRDLGGWREHNGSTYNQWDGYSADDIDLENCIIYEH